MTDKLLKRPHFTKSPNGDFYIIKIRDQFISTLRVKLNGELVYFEDENGVAVNAKVRRILITTYNTSNGYEDTGLIASGVSFPSKAVAEVLRQAPEKIELKLKMEGAFLSELKFEIKNSVLDNIGNTSYYGADNTEVLCKRGQGSEVSCVEVTERTVKDFST